jgi:hypothetical protein
LSFLILIFSPNLLIASSTTFLKLYQQALDGESDQKLAFLVTTKMHAHYNSTLMNSLNTMKGEKFSEDEQFGLFRNNFLIPTLNHIMNRLIPSGIPKHLADYGMWFIYRQFDVEDEDTRRVLSLDDLEFGFVLWLAACSVSLLVFFGEVLLQKSKKYLIKIAGGVEFVQALMARMNQYHDGW